MNPNTQVQDLMTRQVVSLLEEQNLEQVARNLERFHFRHLPVVDGGRLVGILSQRDLLRNTVAGIDPSAAARTREQRFQEQTFVRDVMQTEVLTATPDETVVQAARRMANAKVGALPVVSAAGELVGILTEHDVLRWVAATATER